MIGNDFRQGILILRLQQVLDCAGRQFRERFIGWSGPHCKRCYGIEATGGTAQGRRDFRPGIGTGGRPPHVVGSNNERRHELHRLAMADGALDATPLERVL